MSDGRILLRTLFLALTALTITFVLLFNYVDIQEFSAGTDAVNSVRTVIATAAMIAIGVAVYIARRKND